MFKSQPPVPANMTSFGKRVYVDVIGLRLRSSQTRLGPNLMTYPHNKRERGTQRQRHCRNGHVIARERMEQFVYKRRGCRDGQYPPEGGRVARWGLP